MKNAKPVTTPYEILIETTRRFCENEMDRETYLRDLDGFDAFLEKFGTRLAALPVPEEFQEAPTLRDYGLESLQYFRQGLEQLREFASNPEPTSLQEGLRLADLAHNRLNELQGALKGYQQNLDFFLA